MVVRCVAARGAGLGLVAWFVSLSLTVPAVAFAQTALPGPAAAQPAPAPIAPGSPRAMVERFLESCRQGSYDEAAALLDLPPTLVEKGPRLAQLLAAVLVRQPDFEVDKLSPVAEGDRSDGLASELEEVARIESESGAAHPLRLTRRAGRWRFARDTVTRVEGWYGDGEAEWVTQHLPESWLLPGLLGLPRWQWLALPSLAAIAWAFSLVLGRLTHWALSHAVRRTSARWDDELLRMLRGPVTLGWAITVALALTPWLGLSDAAERLVDRAVHALVLALVFWAAARAIEIARVRIAEVPWVKTRPTTRALLPLLARVTEVLVLLAAVVALLSELGYSVASLVAGLGIGGLAVALAAQKTLENLFGAFALGADQSFAEGDQVRVDSITGTVESIGLRSTKLRTVDRTLVTIPNGKLAEMQLESLAKRDRLRLQCSLGLVYGTTAAQLRAVLAGVEAALRDHPKIWRETVIVRFSRLGESSLDIDVQAWFETTDWSEFLAIREEMLLRFMEIVEREGSSFAFPTRTLHVSKA